MSVVKRWSGLAPEGIKRANNECDKNPIARAIEIPSESRL